MARCPFAQWQGSPNDYPGGMDAEPMGVVLHIEQGHEAGTISVFHNPADQASAHFGIAKTGHIDQFVDTHDAAWAEVAGNPHWISIEHEGFSGESLTSEQIASDARLIAWLKGREGGPGYNFPLVITDDVNRPGLGWHGMGGNAWGGHFDCPGDPIKAQRTEILAEVNSILGGSTNKKELPMPQCINFAGQYQEFDVTDKGELAHRWYDPRVTPNPGWAHEVLATGLDPSKGCSVTTFNTTECHIFAALTNGQMFHAWWQEGVSKAWGKEVLSAVS